MEDCDIDRAVGSRLFKGWFLNENCRVWVSTARGCMIGCNNRIASKNTKDSEIDVHQSVAHAES